MSETLHRVLGPHSSAGGEIFREGKSVRAEGWRRRKAASLLKYLAIHKRLVKVQAIDLFWSESDLEAGATDLSRTLHENRHTLNKSLEQGRDAFVLQLEDGVLSLHDSVWVDAVEFERLAKPNDGIEALEMAVALYQGDLLPDDLYDEWTIPLGESLRRKYRDVCLVLAGRRNERADRRGARAGTASETKNNAVKNVTASDDQKPSYATDLFMFLLLGASEIFPFDLAGHRIMQFHRPSMDFV